MLTYTSCCAWKVLLCGERRVQSPGTVAAEQNGVALLHVKLVFNHFAHQAKPHHYWLHNSSLMQKCAKVKR